MKDRFDLEQEIMKCWNVCDDIDAITSHFIDSPKWQGMDAELCDALMNKYFGIKEVYDTRFEVLLDTFKQAFQLDEYRPSDFFQGEDHLTFDMFDESKESHIDLSHMVDGK